MANNTVATKNTGDTLTAAEINDIASKANTKQEPLGFTPENVANKGTANGYAGLDGTGKVPLTQLPATGGDVPDGGTTGQVLTKASNTDQDTTWVTPSGGGSGSLPVSIADTNSIPFNNMLTVVGDHTMSGALVITPNTVGAVAGCGAVQRIIANGINTPDISAFKKLSTSYEFDPTTGVVNIFMYFFDGISYNVGITQNGEAIEPPGPVYGGEVDAWEARLNAAGYILPSDRKTAYQNFISTLQTDGLYDLIEEMYMFEGGLAATSRLGFKASHDGTLSGGLTHLSTGMKGNGLSGYMDLGFTIDSFTNGGDLHLAVLLRDPTSVGDDVIGVRTPHETFISPRYGGPSYIVMDSAGCNVSAAEWPTVDGRYITSRFGNQLRVTRNGVAPSTLNSTQPLTLVPYTDPLTILASYDGGPHDAFSTQEIGFASVGKALDDSQIAAFDSALSTLFTALGR
ncbi:hypothetical protein PQ469_06485 [Mucilaginibacter sp. KACC 22773]|uniref:hypothetical protein n=1 Tax=Mucilaginibacter sp. KACC 22773 TaxID=3025671 RepID=UPI002366CE03|nr:hypothetical protein [Mucilaginibacter sp. KACC 22773]WDF79652.1 hypothetical protein PQ469_06485 [Mucilaginibacter sp. KACC 22773]